MHMATEFLEMRSLLFSNKSTVEWTVIVSVSRILLAAKRKWKLLAKSYIMPIYSTRYSWLQHYLFGTTDDTGLTESFFNLITPQVANIIKGFGTITDTQPIMDILCEYSKFTRPTKENHTDMITQAAKVALIRLPCFCFQSLVSFFWYKMCIQPMSENVINAIQPEETNSKDQRPSMHTILFVEQLCRFLRFVTASSSITPNFGIAVAILQSI